MKIEKKTNTAMFHKNEIPDVPKCKWEWGMWLLSIWGKPQLRIGLGKAVFTIRL